MTASATDLLAGFAFSPLPSIGVSPTTTDVEHGADFDAVFAAAINRSGRIGAPLGSPEKFRVQFGEFATPQDRLQRPLSVAYQSADQSASGVQTVHGVFATPKL